MTLQTDTFKKLQPVCIELTQLNSIERVKRLRDVLNQCNNDELQEMQLYVVFPLQLILKQFNKISEESFCLATDTLNDVFERTRLQIPKLFIDIFSAYTIILGPSPTKSSHARKLCEEEKLCSVRLVKTLLKNSDQNVIESFYCYQNLAMIGHTISLMIGYAQHEKQKSLRKESVECLVELTCSKRKGPESFLMNAANIAASFLPGISIGLVQVINQNTKQGSSVIEASLVAWMSIVTFILNDGLLEENDNTPDTSNELNNELKDLLVVRNKKWAEETSDKLHVLITRIAGFVIGHSQWKIRFAAVEWASTLLNKSSKLLVKSVPILLEVLVSFIGDKYPRIKEASHIALKNFDENQDRKTNKLLFEILEENLLNLLTSLPRVIRTSGDDVILSTLKLLTGYLKLLGRRLSTLIQSYSHLERLSIALLQSLEFDPTSQIKVLSDTLSTVPSEAINVSARDNYIQLPMKSFRYFTNDNIQRELLTACRYLGYYGDIDVLLDHFMEQVHASSVYRKQAIFVINEIVLGLKERIDSESTSMELPVSDHQQVISAMISEYLSNVLWDTSEISQHSYNDTASHQIDELLAIVTFDQKSPIMKHDSVLQTCLLIEGLGNFAKLLGTYFKRCLIDVLYPVMEKLGDELSIISQTAYNTLLDICYSCKYSSLNDLICQNCDYLANMISIRLRQLSSNLKTPLVLKAMIEHCDVQLMSYIHHIVLDILVCLDDNYSDEAMSLMRVLYSLVVAIKRWFPEELSSETKSETINCAHEMTPHEIKEFFINRQRDHEIASCREEFIDDEETNKPDEDETTTTDDDAESKKEPPTHVSIVLQVLERCVHLMSSENTWLRLLVLDTVINGCQVLQQYQDSLLPMVHKLWSPLVERMKDEKPQVVLKAFHTLGELSEVCGDFLNQRVRKFAIPKVNSFLSSQSVISYKSGPAYKFTVAYKIQLALLTGLGRLCKKLDIHGKTCSEILESCIPYLCAQQPLPLQKACVNTVEYLMQLEREIVWIRLMDTTVVLQHKLTPHPEFNVIQFAGLTNRNEYTDNVIKLIKPI